MKVFIYVGQLIKEPTNLKIEEIGSGTWLKISWTKPEESNSKNLVSGLLFLKEIGDFCSKDGLSRKERLFSTLFVRVGLGRQHTALGIYV